MKKKQEKIQIITSHILLLLFLLLVSNCNKSDPPGQATSRVSVNLTKVLRENIVFYDNTPGTVVALNEVELRSEVSGLVTGIFFREGNFVHKGQKLYEIDRTKYLASFRQAKANLDIAQANLDRAKRYVETYSELNKQNAIARQRLEDARTDLQNANLQLTSAEAGLVKARTDLNYSVIYAPFDGTIGISQVKMGTLITPGQTLLNVISSDNPMGVDMFINEKDLSRFQRIAAKTTSKNDSTFRISLPDNSIYPENGKIFTIDRAVDPQTATIRIRLIFPNTANTLKDGMSCDVNILNENSGEQLVIPFKAVMEQMSEYFVFVADSQKVHQTKITIGAQLEGKVIVANGLHEGQQIVTDGIQKLHNGDLIAKNQEEATRKDDNLSNK